MNPINVRRIGPGHKNPKYIIYAGRKKAGLFSHVIEFLKTMAAADKLKVQPSVIPYWVNDSPYWSTSSYHGKTNVFEYYFKPINDYTVEGVLPIAPTKQDLSKINKDFPGSSKNTNKQLFLRYKVNGCPENVCIVAYRGAHFEENGHLELDIHKYIKVRSFILKKVNEFKKKFMDGQQVIGVHIRGPNCYELCTPLRRLGYKYERNNSLGNVPFKEYFALIDYQLREYPEAKILVATDDSRVLERFKEYYKEKIIHYDAKRAVGGETHFIKEDNPLLKNESKAILGEEVLIEALLLSKSDFFVHGKSNISHAVKLWSPQMPRVDVFGRGQWPKKLRTKGVASKKPRPKIMIISDVKVCRAGHQQIHRDTAFMLAELFNLEYVHSSINIGGRDGQDLSKRLDNFFGITAGATNISKVSEDGLCKVYLRGRRFGKQYNSELEGLDFEYIKEEIKKCSDLKKSYLLFVPNGLFFSLKDLKKYVEGGGSKLFGEKDYARVSNLLKQKFYSVNNSRESYFNKLELNIAVHIRRGDIANPNRKDHVKYLPDKYFIETINKIVSLVKGKFDYKVHIYTESNLPLNSKLENRPDVVVHRSKGSEGIIDDLYHLANADILVQSKSFFSMVAAERSKGFQVLWDGSWSAETLLENLANIKAVKGEKIPLLMSFPCSGAHWIRYCVEYFSGKRTPGKELWAIKGRLRGAKCFVRHCKILLGKAGLANPNNFIMGRSHHPKIVEGRHNKLILLLRNYKELLVRTSFPVSNSKAVVFDKLPEMIKNFHEFNGEKLLVYYEDLVSEDFTTMGKVLSFLGIDYDLSKCDLNELKMRSRKMKGSKSFKNGALQMIYHSLELSPAERVEVDNKFNEKLGGLYNKYLGRYAESNLKYRIGEGNV